MKLAVITPIGPGHADLYETDCLPSIERAKEYSLGPFTEVVPIGMDDTQGLHGRSARRNEAIRKANQEGIEWLFFLDADDFMAPNAFEAFGEDLKKHPDLEAVWGLICELDSAGEPQLRNPQAPEITSYEELLGTSPFQAIQIGHFIKTEAAITAGFDESMDTGEDFKFYYAIWRHHKCRKTSSIYFLNRRFSHSTGPRSATGADWNAVVDGLWKQELADTPGKATIELNGKISSFCITNPKDIIQSHHVHGKFFEEEHLEFLKASLPEKTPVIAEIGANIGNHVVYYAHHMNPKVIYPVEPNPEAISRLGINIAMNGIDHKIDRRGIGLGAGRSEGSFSLIDENPDNLGAVSLQENEGGGIRVVPLDDLFKGIHVDFLKIDVEGMEFDVLAGAKNLIRESRPLIWIEVLNNGAMKFAQKWIRANDYKIIKVARFVNTTDFFAIPKEKQF